VKEALLYIREALNEGGGGGAETDLCPMPVRYLDAMMPWESN
jgi:hypothetical protein